MTITVVRPPQHLPEPRSGVSGGRLLPAEPGLKAGAGWVGRRGGRDRYLDLLGAVALVMFMTYHVFGWVWLPVVFPSMGILFALAGSLVAGSLDHSAGNPWRVLKVRGLGLLPPVWLFGVVTVPVMLVAGWTHSQSAGVPLTWQTLLFWVLPISDPPSSQFGADWVSPIWYVRSYLWFLLLSPAALWLFRHWPKRMMAVPVTVVALSAVGLLPLSGRSGDVILSIAMFGGCWMLGFAHHDHTIRAIPFGRVLAGGGALMGLGLVWAFTHPDLASGYDIGNIPMAGTFFSLGAVLVLLRLNPDFSFMDRRQVLDKVVTVISSRTMTIYLWGNVAIFLANPVLSRWTLTQNLDQDSALGNVAMYLASWLILAALVFMFGWCEDLAAGRHPMINPWPRSAQQLEAIRTRRLRVFGQLPTIATLRARPLPRPSWLADLTPRHLMIVTSCVLASAIGLSAAALAGTHTPGRTTTADAPSRYAVNPRPDTLPPANLGQGTKTTVAKTRPAPTKTLTQHVTAQTPVTNSAPLTTQNMTSLSTSRTPTTPTKPKVTAKATTKPPVTVKPTTPPTVQPTVQPTTPPTVQPTAPATTPPTVQPTVQPTTTG